MQFAAVVTVHQQQFITFTDVTVTKLIHVLQHDPTFGKAPVLIREGGAIPAVMSFRQILDVDTLLLGWERNSDNLHSPDEHLHLADFRSGTLASALLRDAIGNVSQSAA